MRVDRERTTDLGSDFSLRLRPKASGRFPRFALAPWVCFSEAEEHEAASFVRRRQQSDLQENDAHGIRKLFLDDVFLTYLSAFFNPTLRSLRTIEDFSQSRQALGHLSLRTGVTYVSGQNTEPGPKIGALAT